MVYQLGRAQFLSFGREFLEMCYTWR